MEIRTHTTFPCIAEAVAHYYNEGWATDEDAFHAGGRVMKKGNRRVYIRTVGFLEAIASEGDAA